MRYLISFVFILMASMAYAPPAAALFGTPCKDECHKDCEDEGKTCNRKIKIYCKLATVLPTGKVLCEEWKRGCKSAEGYCKAVGCMDAPNECGGGGWGEPHLMSIDRLYFPFQAVGEFQLVTSPSRDIEVQMRTQPVRNSRTVSIIRGIAVRSGDQRITFQKGRDSLIHVNGEPVELEETALSYGLADEEEYPDASNLVYAGDVLLARKDGNYLLLTPDNTIIQVRSPASWMSVNVIPGAGEADFSGLLGDGDGAVENDIQLANGQTLPLGSGEDPFLQKAQLYGEFAHSWRITQGASLFDYGEGETTGTFTDREFPYEPITFEAEARTERLAEAEAACRESGLEDGLFFETCVFDVAVTGEASFAAGYRDMEGTIPVEAKARLVGPSVSLRLIAPESSVSGSGAPSTANLGGGGLAPGVLGSGFAQEGAELEVQSEAVTGESIPIRWQEQDGVSVWIDVVGEEHLDPSAMSTRQGRSFISRPQRGDGPVNEDRVSMPNDPGVYAVRLVKSSSPRDILAMRFVIVREPAPEPEPAEDAEN